jgi:hypothetical protein
VGRRRSDPFVSNDSLETPPQRPTNLRSYLAICDGSNFKRNCPDPAVDVVMIVLLVLLPVGLPARD